MMPESWRPLARIRATPAGFGDSLGSRGKAPAGWRHCARRTCLHAIVRSAVLSHLLERRCLAPETARQAVLTITLSRNKVGTLASEASRPEPSDELPLFGVTA